MLSEDIIKQIFFLSDKPRKDVILADGVDIVQFAQNVASFAALQSRIQEHARCLEIARSHNTAVADLLDQHRPV